MTGGYLQIIICPVIQTGRLHNGYLPWLRPCGKIYAWISDKLSRKQRTVPGVKMKTPRILFLVKGE